MGVYVCLSECCPDINVWTLLADGCLHQHAICFLEPTTGVHHGAVQQGVPISAVPENHSNIYDPSRQSCEAAGAILLMCLEVM